MSLEEKINRLKELAKVKKYSLRISLKGLRYALVFERTPVVEEKSTRERVRWIQVFGKRTLSEVLKDFEIEFIMLERGEELHLFNKLEEALSFLEREV